MQKIHKKILDLFESKFSVKILYGIGYIVILILVFSLGMSVGFHKASFGRAWGDNYERNFGMMPEPPGFGKNNFPNAHGAIGKIIKIELPTIIVQDKNNTEKVILIKNDTKIQQIKKDIEQKNLKMDDFVVIIGSPNNKGQIEAKLIRIMPAPELLNNEQIKNEKPIQ
jgi:hypothetical protein